MSSSKNDAQVDEHLSIATASHVPVMSSADVLRFYVENIGYERPEEPKVHHTPRGEPSKSSGDRAIRNNQSERERRKEEASTAMCGCGERQGGGAQ
jgi:hypothetical protein